MTHRRGAIWTERLLLGLILFSLAGTLNLLVAIHRQASSRPPGRRFRRPHRSRRSPRHRRRSIPYHSTGRPLENPALADKAQPQPPPLRQPKTLPRRRSLPSPPRRRRRPRPPRQPIGARRDRSRVSVSRRRVGSMETARDARSPADRRHHGRCRETRARCRCSWMPSATCSNASATPPRPRSPRQASGPASRCCPTRDPTARGDGRS